MTTSGADHSTAFRRALLRSSHELKRDLPWIAHRDPWAVLVSEFMLQQTQVARVIGPWERFVQRFPTPDSCARAPLSEVLRLWAGLGYNRRAKALHDCARMIQEEFAGVVPRELDELRRLPGVGEYTASAVASFCFAHQVAVIDTNVGRVLARALANRALKASEAKSLATELLGSSPSATFNQAMLDLGAQYCKSQPLCESCPVSSVCAWHQEGGADPAPNSAAVSRAQSRFAGSDRQLRGRIMNELRAGPRSTKALFIEVEESDVDRGDTILKGLEREGLVERRGRKVQLVGDG